MTIQNADVAIVGGGMVGLSLALALAQSKISVAVIDTTTGDKGLSDTPENRVSAISLASENILRRLGAWPGITRQRLRSYSKMSVWEQDSFANIDFDSQQVVKPALGHIIENRAIRKALWDQAQGDQYIRLLAPASIERLVFGQQEAFITLQDGGMLSARLVVGADGANSWVRQQAALPITFWDYEHQAIVATVRTELAHDDCARQVFTPSGPLALLPLYDEHLCSVVWSQQATRAEELMAMDDEAFGNALTATFDGRLGMCQTVTKREMYPLKMRYVRQWVKDRVVVIGDAAHTIHPLAGQGVNLGFLDAAALAETIAELVEKDADIGLAENLRGFERWRKTEATKMIAAMEGFKQLFSGSHPVKKLVRDLGLSLTNKLPMAKQQIIQQAMGLSGELPAMAKEPVETE